MNFTNDEIDQHIEYRMPSNNFSQSDNILFPREELKA